MSKKYLGFLMLALAVSVAGCAFIPGMAPQEKQAGEGIAPLISLPSSTPPADEASGQAPAAKPFDLSGARWMEYRLTSYNNGQPGTSTVRLEYERASTGGGTMVSMKRTQTSNDASSISALNGGTLFSMSRSSSQDSMTSNTMAPFEQAKANDPILRADDISGYTAGAESVTVPEGTFDCKKYVGSFRGSESVYWGAPGVPVPVKIYTACDGTTLELVDWG